MAYHYSKFGHIIIPRDGQKITFQKQIQDGSLVPLPNGSFYSAYQNTPLALADVNISFILARNTISELLDAYAEWEASLLELQQAMLWRRPNSSPDESQKCLAKYKSINATPPDHQSGLQMQVTVTFSLLNSRWQDPDILVTQQEFVLGASGAKTLTFLPDRGKSNVEINNVRAFVQVNNGTVSKVMFQPENLSRSFSYELPLIAGDNLAINDELNSVIKNYTQNSYGGTTQGFATDQEASSSWLPFTRYGALIARIWGSEGASGYVKISYSRTYA